MLAPCLSTRTDDERHAVVIRVIGPLVTVGHVDALCASVVAVPVRYGVVVDLGEVTDISQVAVEGMRDLAMERGRSGARFAIACNALEVRTYLVIADLDTLAPVVHTTEQALPLVALAA